MYFCRIFLLFPVYFYGNACRSIRVHALLLLHFTFILRFFFRVVYMYICSYAYTNNISFFDFVFPIFHLCFVNKPNTDIQMDSHAARVKNLILIELLALLTVLYVV